MIIEKEVASVEQLPLDASLLAQIVKIRCVSAADDQSTRVVANEIGAADAIECGSEKDDSKEKYNSEAKGDYDFAARWRLGRRH
jgi:hypothetical protein